MKHYLLALAGLMAVSATATDRLSFREGFDPAAKSKSERMVSSVKTPVINSRNLQIKADKLSNTEIQNVKVANVAKTNMASTKTNAGNITFRKIKSATDNADSDNSIAGSYTVTIGDYYFSSSVGGAFDENATIEEADGQIVISCDYFPYNVVADYDAESGVITFSEMYVGTFDFYGTTYFINFEPFNWDDEIGVVVTSWTATFDASTGVISTGIDDNGFSWMAYTDEALTDAYSYLELFDVEGFTKNQMERQEIAGEYDIYIGDYYLPGGVGSFKDRATIVEEDGMIVISSEYFMTDVVAEYNAATGDITFNSYYCGSTTLSDGTVYYVNFEPFNWDDEIGVVVTSWTARFNPYTGAITTPADHGLSWVAYKDEDLTEMVGYFDIFDLGGLEKVKVVERSWVSVGEATFMDGWVLPVFGFDQTDPANWYKVPVEQDEDDANVYRLVNPYQYGPAAEYNETTKPGYIEFDVTDPDHVVFAVTDAGFVNSALGVSQFYCLNTLTWYCEYFSMTPSDIIMILGDEDTYTTFQNGVVTLSAVEDEEYGYSNDACFGIQGDPAGGYSWIGEDNKFLNMATAINLSETSGMTGAVKIENNSSAAPVRFFNLQGIEVTNPAAGQVVIRIQGENAAKMIVR